MIVPLIEWARDVQSHVTTGVNPQLATVPRTPGQSAPAAVTIYNENDHDWVARGIVPRDVLTSGLAAIPILIIGALRDEKGFRTHALPEFEQKDPTILSLVLLYACRKIESASPSGAVTAQHRDARQVIRTAMRVFAQQFENSNTAIVTNGCTITLSDTGFVFNVAPPEPADDLVLDALIASFRVQDAWALGL